MLAVLQPDNCDAKARAVKRNKMRMRIGVDLMDINYTNHVPYRGHGGLLDRMAISPCSATVRRLGRLRRDEQEICRAIP